MAKARDFGSQMVGCIGVLLAFAALNGVLWLGQRIYHRSDVKEAERLEVQLNQLDAQIRSDEGWLHLNRSYYETRGPADVFNARIDQHNAGVASYNALVEQYNAVAKKAYSTWYLIPIPGGRRTSHVARPR